MNNTNCFSFRHRWDLVSNDSALFTEGSVFYKVFTEIGWLGWLVPKENWCHSFLRRGWQRGHHRCPGPKPPPVDLDVAPTLEEVDVYTQPADRDRCFQPEHLLGGVWLVEVGVEGVWKTVPVFPGPSAPTKAFQSAICSSSASQRLESPWQYQHNLETS